MECLVDQSAMVGALKEFIASRSSANTRQNYRNGLNRFARWLGKADREEAMIDLLCMGKEAANRTMRRYRAYLEGDGLKSQTVDVLIAPMRAFTRVAKERGLVEWCVSFSQQGVPRKVLSKVVEAATDPKHWTPGSLERKVHAALNRFAVGKKRNTWKSYTRCFQAWGAFLQVATVEEALAKLVVGTRANAYDLVLEYQLQMERRNLSSSTIAQSLIALRSFVKFGQNLDLVGWNLDGVRPPKVECYKDTRGPGRDAIAEVVARLEEKDDAASRRNLAIIKLLYVNGLRIAEALSLDLEHLDLAGSRMFVLEKGSAERSWFTLGAETCRAIRDWLKHRGLAPGPLFTGLRDGGRYRRESAYRMTTGYGLKNPHGLRHAGITRVLDLTNGNLRKTQRYSRHKNLNLLLRYDDNRQDLHGEAARDLERDLILKEPKLKRGPAV